MDEQEKNLPIQPDEKEKRLAERKAMEEETMKTAIFIGLILGCLIGAIIGSLAKGMPIGIAAVVIVELILQKKRRKAWDAEEQAAESEEKQ